MQTLAERLQAALDRNPALSQAELARACGVSSASVSNWFTGETKTLRAKNLRHAAHYLGCSRDWLETGLGTPGWTESQHSNEGVATALVAQEVSQSDPYPDRNKTTRVPVIGKLEMGANKQLFLRVEPGGSIGTVPTLPGGPDSFAVLVMGDHLYPAVRHGACLVVEPASPLTAGEPVFIETTEGHYLVGDLVADRPEAVTISMLQGSARTTLQRSEIAAVNPITAVVMASKFAPRPATDT